MAGQWEEKQPGALELGQESFICLGLSFLLSQVRNLCWDYYLTVTECLLYHGFCAVNFLCFLFSPHFILQK